MIVVDFAYGWTDEAYNGGTARMDAPVEQTRLLLDAARAKGVPIYYTTLNYRPDEVETGGMVDFKPFEGKLEGQRGLGGRPNGQETAFRPFDERACEIDARLGTQHHSHSPTTPSPTHSHSFIRSNRTPS